MNDIVEIVLMTIAGLFVIAAAFGLFVDYSGGNTDDDDDDDEYKYKAEGDGAK